MTVRPTVSAPVVSTATWTRRVVITSGSTSEATRERVMDRRGMREVHLLRFVVRADAELGEGSAVA